MLDQRIIDKRAHAALTEALLMGVWRNVLSRLTRRPNRLLSFNSMCQHLPLHGQKDIGLHVVCIEQIIGSMNRYQDFDRAFFPRRLLNSERWLRICKATYQ